MKEVTRNLIENYKLQRHKLDFMGFYFRTIKDLSYHHLIIPNSECELYGVGDGIYEWNGAILEQDTSHPLLHLVQEKDLEIYDFIRQCMIRINMSGSLQKEELLRMHEVLNYFIKEHSNEKNSKGKLIIKPKMIEYKEIGFQNIKKRL